VNQTAAMPLVERASSVGPSPISAAAISSAAVSSSLMATPPMAMSALPSPALAATQKAVAQTPAALAAMQAAVLQQGTSSLTPAPAISAPRSATIASTPPPALPSHVIGNGANVGPTHLSAQSPGGTSSHHAPMPSISVIEAPGRPTGMAPYWVVGLVAFVAFGLGLALGILIG
jgi:hypothetical protein